MTLYLRSGFAILVAVVICGTDDAAAEDTLSVGVWGNYQYLPSDDANENAWGEIGSEALILYADRRASAGEGRYSYSAELRIGPGSFTDPLNNSSGDQFALHKAWVGWQLDDGHQLTVGKSQVPFAWKTINFWPGDMLLAGHGDQMDVGAKLTGRRDPLRYDLAFYLSDDWGSTSTDTLDDNRHWGSSTTYRKVQIWVGNLSYDWRPEHQLGVSLQSGGLQDLSGTAERPVSGSHAAAALYYIATIGNSYAKASYIDTRRHLPEAYVEQVGLPEEIHNRRYAIEIGYNTDAWSFYLDVSAAEPETRGSSADAITAWAPGARYDYGPGWVYVEYLTQNGFIDRDGRVQEGDFDAVYVSLDFYL